MAAEEIFAHRDVEIRLAKDGYGSWQAWSGGRRLTQVHQDKELIRQEAIHSVNHILDKDSDWQAASGIMNVPPPAIRHIK